MDNFSIKTDQHTKLSVQESYYRSILKTLSFQVIQYYHKIGFDWISQNSSWKELAGKELIIWCRNCRIYPKDMTQKYGRDMTEGSENLYHCLRF